jgi:hypothetical protein
MTDYGQIEISAEMEHESEKAFLLFDGDKRVWVPKSQVKWIGKNLWEMPEWLAKDKGLI